jgi:hypothetical protein
VRDLCARDRSLSPDRWYLGGTRRAPRVRGGGGRPRAEGREAIRRAEERKLPGYPVLEPPFPEPVVELRCGPVWTSAQLAEYRKTMKRWRGMSDFERGRFISRAHPEP